MQKLRVACLLSLCSLGLAACALEDPKLNANGPATERVYVTGSNIAKRQPGNVTVIDREEAQREMNLHTSMPLPMPGGAH